MHCIAKVESKRGSGYFTRRCTLSSDITKARIYNRRCDATNSLNCYYNKDEFKVLAVTIVLNESDNNANNRNQS